MKIAKGQVFKVVSSVTYKNDRLHATNTGWVTTSNHEPGIKLASSGGYLVVAKCSAIQNIEFCPKCCLMYGKTFTKCGHCESHVSFN